jgi:hypothetical protein
VGTSKSLYAPIFFKTKLEGRRLLSVRDRLFIYFFQQAKCTDYVPIFPSLPAANTVVKPTLTLVADAAVRANSSEALQIEASKSLLQV